MLFNIENLGQELQEAVKEFEIFSVDKKGVTIQAKQGKDNVAYDGEKLTITYSNKARFIYSLFVFDTLKKTGGTSCAFETFSVMVDMSRNAVRTVEMLKDYMKKLVLMGYTAIQLYMEDVYEIPDEPYFGHKRGRYSQNELKEIVSYGKKIGMKCVPAIQTLAHLDGITRWRKFALTVIDTSDILLIDEPKTYELIDKMFQSLRACFDCEEINIGMDEAHWMGMGKYMNLHGYPHDKFGLFLRHLTKVLEIASKHGFTKPMMWGDMFIRISNNGEYIYAKNFHISEEVKNAVPENITLCAWHYYSLNPDVYKKFINAHKAFNRSVSFASGAVSWLGITPLNKHSIKQNEITVQACKKAKIDNYMVTVWSDDGAECSPYAILPTLAYTSARAYGERSYKKLFARMTGIPFNRFMRIDSPNEIAELERYFLVAQPARYMLFNDCLQGLYDSTVTLGDYKKYKAVARNLHNLTKNVEYGYLFKTQETLAKIMYYKYELTIKTRTAYVNGDKATLQQIVDVDYKKILKYLDEFYEDFYYQWHKESKPQGFEVQDYRLGGLKQRLRNGRRTIQEYLNGKTQTIPELEEPMLSVMCDTSRDGKAMDARTFAEVVTANVYTHHVK